MAWGLFNKVKKGFKKVGSAFKKGVTWVNDNVVKPFKPLIKAAADAYYPGAGKAVDIASGGIDAISRGDLRSAKQSGEDFSNWLQQRR